jgi:hypothetical protein
MTEPPHKSGVHHLKIDQKILDEVRMHKCTNKGYKSMIKVEIKLLQLWFKVYKMEKQKVLEKIEHFSISIYLDDIRADT